MIQDNFSLLKRVSENIRYFRTVNNLSQEELATLAELDRTYISGVERGVRNLTINSLEKIIQALNISNEDFFKTMF
ncbi:TPA: helix-turn-helix domain-containing protein [Neisseria cinerea]